jgi:hypothetical protein
MPTGLGLAALAITYCSHWFVQGADHAQSSMRGEAVRETRRVAKVDDNGGASANVSYQLPRQPAIALYPVHACHKTGTSVVGAAL